MLCFWPGCLLLCPNMSVFICKNLDLNWCNLLTIPSCVACYSKFVLVVSSDPSDLSSSCLSSFFSCMLSYLLICRRLILAVKCNGSDSSIALRSMTCEICLVLLQPLSEKSLLCLFSPLSFHCP